MAILDHLAPLPALTLMQHHQTVVTWPASMAVLHILQHEGCLHYNAPGSGVVVFEEILTGGNFDKLLLH